MKNSEKPPPSSFVYNNYYSLFAAINLNASVRLNGEPINYYPFLYKKTLTNNSWQNQKQKEELSFLKRLKAQVISDMSGCRSLWNHFSYCQTLFDIWDFRYAFWLGYPNDPYFLTLFIDEEPVAVLPLWYEESKQKYFWFGSWWQEDNSFFVKDPLFAPLLIALAPKPLYLNAINNLGKKQLNGHGMFVDDDPKYILDLSGYSSIDQYLLNLKKKKRYNLKRDKKIIESQNPKIIYNRFSDYKKLTKLAINRFALKGEDCDFDDPGRVEQFRQVIKLGLQNKQYKVRMITIMINNQVAAVDLVAIYKSTYYALKCGSNINKYPGIGNYMNMLEIEDAIALGLRKIDFLEENYGWKDKWFDTIPLYKLEK